MSTAHRFGCTILASVALMAASYPAWSRVWYVNAASAQAPADGSSFAQGFHAVQDGLNAAQAGDEVWVEQGTYPEHVTIGSQVSLYGGFSGTETSRDQADPTSHPTVLDGGGQQPSIVTMAGVTTPVLDGFTLQNGKGTHVGAGDDGGGVYMTGATAPTISRCVFQANSLYQGPPPQGSNGGAIFIQYSSQAKILNNVFRDSHAIQGGAMAVWYGEYILQGNQFSGNSAQLGGALFVRNGAVLDASDNTFTGNSASSEGGAIYGIVSGAETIAHNTFTGNSAQTAGGACYIENVSAFQTLRNTFTGNTTAGTGGAIYVLGQTDVTRDLVAGNLLLRNVSQATAAYACGGVYASNATVTGNTIAGSTGDGVYLVNHCVAANNIVTQSSALGLAMDGLATAELRNNDAWGNGGGDFQNAPPPPASNISADPLYFNAAADDIRLKSGSPCRDAGSSADASATGLAYDLEGQSRFYGPAVDIGADEIGPYVGFQTFPRNVQVGTLLDPQPVVAAVAVDGVVMTDFTGPVTLSIGSGPSGAALHGTTTQYAANGVATFTDLSIDTFGTYTLAGMISGSSTVLSPEFGVLLPRCYVKPTGDDGNLGDTWAAARRTIASALSATAGPDGEVWVAAGTYDGNLSVPAGVTLYGGFSGSETSLNQRGVHGMLKTSTINGNGVAQCVRFVNSDSNGIDNFRLTGGIGFLVQKIGSSPHREGGGVYIENASPRITNCRIENNSALYGGGIAGSGGHPDIRYNVIAQNAATASGPLIGAGGGIAISGGTLCDNLIVGNTATGASTSNVPSVGGGLLVSGSADIHNNTVAGNQSPSQQGDIYISAGSARFTNNIIRNRAGIEKVGGTPAFSHNDYVRGLAVANPLPDPTGTNGNINTVPVFVNEASGDYHLPAGSPLIDVGDNSATLTGETDLDGQSRIYNGTVDIGADEIAPALYTLADVTEALSVAGGLQSLSSTDLARLDVESPAGVDVQDALRLARKVVGMDANP